MSPQHWRELESLIAGELARARELHDLLVEEAGALARLQHERLLELVAAKQTVVEAFEALARRRHDLMRRAGWDADAAALKRLMQDSAAPPSLVRCFDQLVETTSVCADLNTRNARLNQNGEAQLLRLLRVLRGQPAEPDTYAPAQGDSPTGHTLAKA
ncbi:MAG: flagellar protein FlgN [Gammaproteobacteria bacterium]|jgi:flagellar biosynthesis/type III secretory pathway chaperone